MSKFWLQREPNIITEKKEITTTVIKKQGKIKSGKKKMKCPNCP